MSIELNNCMEASKKISQAKQLKRDLNLNINDLNKAWQIKSELEKVLEESFEQFSPDQIGFRDKIAKEKGYEYVGVFNRHGIAWARSGGFSKLINKEGNIVAPNPDRNIDFWARVSDGVFPCSASSEEGRKNTIYWFVNGKGERINDTEYEVATVFKDGRAIVKEFNKDHYAFIDQSGREIDRSENNEGIAETHVTEGFIKFHRNGGEYILTSQNKRIPEETNINTTVYDIRVYDELVVAKLDRDDQNYVCYNKNGELLNTAMFSRQDIAKVCVDESTKQIYLRTADGKIYQVDSDGRVLQAIDDFKDYNDFDVENNICLVEYYAKNPDEDFWHGEHFLFDLNTKKQLFADMNFRLWNSAGDWFCVEKDGQLYFADRKENLYKLDSDINLLQGSPFGEGVLRVGKKISETETEEIYLDRKGRRVFS